MNAGDQNQILHRLHPAAARLLSPLGRRAILPEGIPQQTAQSAHCVRQATIGQITTGDGRPLALPSIARQFPDMDPRAAFLYAPQHGFRSLREAWARRLGLPSLPLVTSGMSHGISLALDLFTSETQPLLLPTPYWDNYEVIGPMRTGAPIRTFPFYGPDGRFAVQAMAELLAATSGPAVLLLNFPNNPCGYAPWADEAEDILQVILAHPHPLAVVCDDAYHGLFFERGMYGRSLFHALAERADPERLLACKVDGATKELVFFGGRVGFLSFSATGEAADILLDKAAGILRGTISSVAAPSQVAVLTALRSPTLEAEQAAVVEVLAGRYHALREAFATHDLQPWSFNSGCFCSLPVDEDPDQLRHRLIAEQSVGVIAVRQARAIRVAFCAIEAEDVPDLVRRIAAGLR